MIAYETIMKLDSKFFIWSTNLFNLANIFPKLNKAPHMNGSCNKVVIICRCSFIIYSNFGSLTIYGNFIKYLL